MAKDKLTDYDSTAANNLDVGGISVAEGMLPSGVNNAIRELMSHQADAFGAGTPLYVDQTNNRLGINQASPAHPLHVGTDDLILDASGNLLVGKTSSSFGTTGIELQGDGELISTRAGTTAYFNRLSTDGSGTARDNAVNFGDSGSRFKDLFLSGGVYLGGTGSANLLDDYEEGSFSPSLGAVSTSTNAGSANYVKIGDMVFCRGYIAWTGLDTGDGSAFQFTLPFAPNLTDDNASGNSAVQVSMNTKETTGLTGILADVLGARIVSTGIVALTGAETDITYNSGVDASGEFHFHISYRAT